jgi:penicillin-binding protein-related factor A (putative recombinase)
MKQGRGIVLGPGSPLRQDLEASRRGSTRTRAGKSFEDELDRVHALYERQGIAKLEHVPIPTVPTHAKDRYGRVLRIASASEAACDYLGIATLDGRDRTVVFDAKSFDAATYTHEPKQRYQLAKLLEYKALGAEAFLLLRATTLGVCYLVRDEASLRLLHAGGAITLREAVFGGEGSGRRKRGDASKFRHHYPTLSAPAELLVREDVVRWNWLSVLRTLVREKNSAR